MKHFSEFVDDLAAALLEKDEALYRATLSKSFNFNLSPDQLKSLIESGFARAEEIGGDPDKINDWVVSIDSLFSVQEKRDILSQAKFLFTEELLECGMELGADFALTPNGSIRIISENAWKTLLQNNEKNFLEWAIQFKVLRVPKKK